MRRYQKEQTQLPEQAVEEVSEAFDVDALLAKGGVILQREIANLMRESAKGKLSTASAKDLVSFLDMLHELRDREIKDLSNLTDEQLKELANKK